MSKAASKATPGMITHYGLFWSERDVFWGRQKVPGEMRGKLNRRQKKSVNYREYVGLYCLYGDNELLYIGEAGLGTKSDLMTRLKQHRKGPMADRWDRFSWFGCERKSLRDQTDIENAFRQLEAVTIAIINPGFNKQSGTFKGAKQVFQAPHNDSVGNLETRLSRIEEKLEELIKVEVNKSKRKSASEKRNVA